MPAPSPRVYEFDVSVDRARTARSGLGGTPARREVEWWAEHLVLVGLVRCTLASMDHAAHRAELEVTGSGWAHGKVTKRNDGRYAFVQIDVYLEIETDPQPDAETVRQLVAKAEHGCFVGNSLAPGPRYHWTVNGEAVA